MKFVADQVTTAAFGILWILDKTDHSTDQASEADLAKGILPLDDCFTTNEEDLDVTAADLPFVSSKDLQIFVRTLDGKSLPVIVNLADTVQSAKAKIAITTGLTFQHQRLLFGGKELNDSLTLFDYNIQRESTLELSGRLFGGAGNCIHDLRCQVKEASKSKDARQVSKVLHTFTAKVDRLLEEAATISEKVMALQDEYYECFCNKSEETSTFLALAFNTNDKMTDAEHKKYMQMIAKQMFGKYYIEYNIVDRGQERQEIDRLRAERFSIKQGKAREKVINDGRELIEVIMKNISCEDAPLLKHAHSRASKQEDWLGTTLVLTLFGYETKNAAVPKLYEHTITVVEISQALLQLETKYLQPEVQAALRKITIKNKDLQDLVRHQVRFCPEKFSQVKRELLAKIAHRNNNRREGAASRTIERDARIVQKEVDAILNTLLPGANRTKERKDQIIQIVNDLLQPLEKASPGLKKVTTASVLQVVSPELGRNMSVTSESSKEAPHLKHSSQQDNLVDESNVESDASSSSATKAASKQRKRSQEKQPTASEDDNFGSDTSTTASEDDSRSDASIMKPTRDSVSPRRSKRHKSGSGTSASAPSESGGTHLGSQHKKRQHSNSCEDSSKRKKTPDTHAGPTVADSRASGQHPKTSIAWDKTMYEKEGEYIQAVMEAQSAALDTIMNTFKEMPPLDLIQTEKGFLIPDLDGFERPEAAETNVKVTDVQMDCGEKHKPFAMGLDNVVTPAFRDYLLGVIVEKCKFVKCDSNRDRWSRVASRPRTGDLDMKVGQLKIPSVEASPAEVALMDAVQYLMKNYFIDKINEQLRHNGSPFHLPDQPINMVHVFMGIGKAGTYEWHSDDCKCNTSEPKKVKFVKSCGDAPLPLKETMIVASLVIGDDGCDSKVEWQWRPEDKPSGPVAELTTTSNAMHWQSAGAQGFGLQHKSSPIETGSSRRMVFSFRFYLTTLDEAEYLQSQCQDKGITKASSSYAPIGVSPPQGSSKKGSTRQTFNPTGDNEDKDKLKKYATLEEYLYSKENPDTKMDATLCGKLCPNVPVLCNYPRTVQAKENERMSLFKDFETMQELLMQGKMAHFCYENVNGEKKALPALLGIKGQEILLPGQTVSFSDVLPVHQKTSQRSHPYLIGFGNAMEHLLAMIGHFWYKNPGESHMKIHQKNKEWIEKLKAGGFANIDELPDDIYREKNGSALFDEEDDSDVVYMKLSGGSEYDAGGSAPHPRNMTCKDAHRIANGPQSFSVRYKNIYNLCASNQPIAVFRNCKTWDGLNSAEATESEKLVFEGYFYIEEVIHHRIRGLDRIFKLFEKCEAFWKSSRFRSFTTYLQNKHTTVKLRAALNGIHYKYYLKQMLEKEDFRFEIVPVPHNDKRVVTMEEEILWRHHRIRYKKENPAEYAKYKAAKEAAATSAAAAASAVDATTTTATSVETAAGASTTGAPSNEAEAASTTASRSTYNVSTMGTAASAVDATTNATSSTETDASATAAHSSVASDAAMLENAGKLLAQMKACNDSCLQVLVSGNQELQNEVEVLAQKLEIVYKSKKAVACRITAPTVAATTTAVDSTTATTKPTPAALARMEAWLSSLDFDDMGIDSRAAQFNGPTQSTREKIRRRYRNRHRDIREKFIGTKTGWAEEYHCEYGDLSDPEALVLYLGKFLRHDDMFITTAPELLRLMMQLAAAVGARAIGVGGYDTQKGFATPLLGKQEDPDGPFLAILLNFLKLHPTPGPFRGADVNVAHLTSNIRKLDTLSRFPKDKRIKGYTFEEARNDKEKMDTLKQALIMAIVHRHTGKTVRFDQFEEWRQKKQILADGRKKKNTQVNEDPSQKQSASETEADASQVRSVPSTKEELEEFLEYLKFVYAGKTDSAKVTSLRSKQHPKSLLEKTGLVFELMELFSRLDSTIDKFITNYSGDATRTRKAAILALSDLLLEATGSDANKPCQVKKARFTAYMVVADLEEVFDTPFGEVTEDSIFPGYGGETGHCFMRMDKTKGMKGDPMSFTQMLEQIKATLDDWDKEHPKLKLLCLGALGLQEIDGNLYWKMNGRELNLVDMEHWCCKLHIMISLSYSSRSGSQKPEPYKHYCTPVLTLAKLRFLEKMNYKLETTWSHFLGQNMGWQKEMHDHHKQCWEGFKKLFEQDAEELVKAKVKHLLVPPGNVMLPMETKFWKALVKQCGLKGLKDNVRFSEAVNQSEENQELEPVSDWSESGDEADEVVEAEIRPGKKPRKTRSPNQSTKKARRATTTRTSSAPRKRHKARSKADDDDDDDGGEDGDDDDASDSDFEGSSNCGSKSSIARLRRPKRRCAMLHTPDYIEATEDEETSDDEMEEKEEAFPAYANVEATEDEETSDDDEMEEKEEAFPAYEDGDILDPYAGLMYPYQ